MKKLLVLMVILGLASASYGTLTATLVGNTLTISSDDGEGIPAGTYNYYGLYDLSGESTWSGGAILPTNMTANAGEARALSVYSDETNGFGMDFMAGSLMVSSTWLPQAGDWYSVTVTGLSVGDELDLEDVDNGYESIGTLIVQAPEPMTLSLLGLGGLFLRRRK